MSSAAHMMDDMIEDPNYAMGGHMSMMPNSMGGMRPIMGVVDQMGGQGAGAGRMASPQWLQHQQQMRCMPSEYQRYPSHMSQQGMGMYGGGGGLPPQVQRVRMNFGGGGGGGGHPQGFPSGDGGMMAQYNHMQQQQQQMMMHQKRMQLKSQMAAAAAASIRSGPPTGMQTAPSQSIVSQQQQQRGLSQIQMEMQTTQTQQQQQQQPSQQPQQQTTVPQAQQPTLPCSLPPPSMASSAPGASGLRPTTQGLAKRAPSPRRPPPHYADTVSMQSMARMQRMMPGVLAPQHGAGLEMAGYGTEQSHLRFPMAPDYSQSLGGAPMEGVQQFPSSTHSSLARFPNNMPQ